MIAIAIEKNARVRAAGSRGDREDREEVAGIEKRSRGTFLIVPEVGSVEGSCVRAGCCSSRTRCPMKGGENLDTIAGNFLAAKYRGARRGRRKRGSDFPKNVTSDSQAL